MAKKSNLNKQSYNKIVEEWKNIRKTACVNSLIVKFTKMLEPKSSILDVGCGAGQPIDVYLSDEGFSVVGIDASGNMIRKARELNLASVDFIETDFFDYKADLKFDGMIAFHSLFHFEKDDQKLVYQKASALLKSGGLFLFTHGKNDCETHNNMFGENFYYNSPGKDVILHLLGEAGFEIILAEDDYEENNDKIELFILARKI